MHQVFASWSGGKDSCLACHQANRNGLKVRYLLNMITEDGKRSWTHGLSTEVLQLQSQAIGIPLVQRKTTAAGYEAGFKDTLRALKREGVTGGVFGDIDLEEHRQWVESTCQAVDITPYLPLWGRKQDEVMREIIDLKFEAVLVATRADLFGEEWLGRKIDSDFIKHSDELRKTKNLTPCGEAGEYHTFVIDGPIFCQRLEIMEANKVLREGYWFLEIQKCKLKSE